MKEYFKYLVLLLLISAGVILAAIVFRPLTGISFRLSDLIILTASFTLISAAAIIIFFRGSRSEGKEQVMFTLVAVSVKFLAELFLALSWFLLAKKTSSTNTILFFLLYLTFSLFSIGVMMKTLKKKTL